MSVTRKPDGAQKAGRLRAWPPGLLLLGHYTESRRQCGRTWRAMARDERTEQQTPMNGSASGPLTDACGLSQEPACHDASSTPATIAHRF